MGLCSSSKQPNNDQPNNEIPKLQQICRPILEERLKQKDRSIVPFTHLLGLANHGYSLTWFISIFSYIGFNEYQTYQLRSYCTLFAKALARVPKHIAPMPHLWIEYPNTKYSSLRDLIDRISIRGNRSKPKISRWQDKPTYPNWEELNRDRFDHLKKKKAQRIPLVFVKNGVHSIGDNQDKKYSFSLTIIGESRDGCIIPGLRGRRDGSHRLRHIALSRSNPRHTHTFLPGTVGGLEFVKYYEINASGNRPRHKIATGHCLSIINVNGFYSSKPPEQYKTMKEAQAEDRQYMIDYNQDKHDYNATCAGGLFGDGDGDY